MRVGRVGALAALTAILLCVINARVQDPPPRQPVEAATKTIVIYGPEGGFGALGETVPSGQETARVHTPGPLVFAPGRWLDKTVRAADGTLLMTGTSHNGSRTLPASGEMVIGAYDPDAGLIDTIRLSTSTGRQTTTNSDGYRVGATVSDLLPLPGGAVAFTAWPARLGQDVASAGVWPVFGVLTRTDGMWQVAAQWTPQRLSASFCAGDHDCLRPHALALLPASGDLIVAQADGALTALRLTGPDGTGQFTLQVTAHLRYPIPITFRDVHADPTGELGRERFAVGIDVADGPGVVQEFSYDSRRGLISVASAPVLPGDLRDERTFWGYRHSLYDHAGNLWVSRQDGPHAGALAVYTGPLCPPGPQWNPADHWSVRGQARAWGRSCPPSSDILQAQALPPARGLVEDQATGTVVLLADDGVLMAVRAGPSTSGLTFEIGNVVDLGHKLLATATTDSVSSGGGVIGADHRLWVPTARISPSPDGLRIDHLMVSVAVDRLFAPPPVVLPTAPGRSLVVQAELTVTTATSQRRRDDLGAVVDSAVFVRVCADWPPILGCAYDGQPGNGFLVADNTGFGHLSGAIDYRVSVPASGYYRVSYQVGTFAVTTDAEIELIAGGAVRHTSVSTPGDWRQIEVPKAVFLSAGVHTLTVRARPGRGGWYLNSFTLTRV